VPRAAEIEAALRALVEGLAESGGAKAGKASKAISKAGCKMTRFLEWKETLGPAVGVEGGTQGAAVGVEGTQPDKVGAGAGASAGVGAAAAAAAAAAAVAAAAVAAATAAAVSAAAAAAAGAAKLSSAAGGGAALPTPPWQARD
jgi:hypothetical protein